MSSTMKMPGFFFLTVLPFISGGCTHSDSVRGRVEKTEQGRDKYMLYMTDDNNTVYRIIVSRTAMGGDYRDVNLGDAVRVWGDTVHWQNEVHMKAKALEVLH
ncbi:MAG: hypothetical protein WKF70_13010 [Chitinophagaceae bacterium]